MKSSRPPKRQFPKTPQAYVRLFGKATLPEHMKIGRRYYIVPEEVKQVHSKTGQEAFGLGLYIGQEKGDSFMPSIGFLDAVEGAERRATITKEAEWLFLCGRDVFPKNITKIEGVGKGAEEGMFLVQNELGETLGIGDLRQEREGFMLKNLLDRGDFLRREHHD